MALWLPWTAPTSSNIVAMGRVVLFLAGGVAGWVAVSRRSRVLQTCALVVAAVAAVEFLWRLPRLLWNLDVAVANGGWFGVLSANSVFVALIVAGFLILRAGRFRNGDGAVAV